MTVLLTGASGLIGRAFLALADGTTEVVAVARDPDASRHGASGEGVQWLGLDLTDPGFAARLPSGIDAIVHLAQSAEYRRFPDGAIDVFDVNLSATARLLDYARRAGVRRFVFASTGTIYEPSREPLTESSPVRCASFYAASKRAAELLIEQYGTLLSCWLLRIFTVYGPGQDRQLIANLVRRVAEGEPVTVEGANGLPLSPIHAADVAEVLWHAASGRDEPADTGCEVVNVSGREALGIRALADNIARAIGVQPRFVSVGGDDPPGWVSGREKLERTFTLAEPRSFAAGIRDTLAGGAVTAVGGAA